MSSEPGKITRLVLERSPDSFLDKEVLSGVIGRMVKFIAKSKQEREGIRRSS